VTIFQGMVMVSSKVPSSSRFKAEIIGGLQNCELWYLKPDYGEKLPGENDPVSDKLISGLALPPEDELDFSYPLLKIIT
jgi:hypothetical protein